MKVWISYAKFEAYESKEDEVEDEVGTEFDVKPDVNEQKKQCLQRGRSKPISFLSTL